MTDINFAAISLVALFTVLLLSAAYWQMVRPVLILRVQYNLYALRDQLRRKAINEKLPTRGPVYSYLESLINKSIVIFPTVSILNVLMVDLPPTKKNPMDKETDENLQMIRDQTAGNAFAMILLNSPLFAVAGGISLVCIKLWDGLKPLKYMSTRTERYAQTLTSPTTTFAGCPAS